MDRVFMFGSGGLISLLVLYYNYVHAWHPIDSLVEHWYHQGACWRCRTPSPIPEVETQALPSNKTTSPREDLPTAEPHLISYSACTVYEVKLFNQMCKSRGTGTALHGSNKISSCGLTIASNGTSSHTSPL